MAAQKPECISNKILTHGTQNNLPVIKTEVSLDIGTWFGLCLSFNTFIIPQET